MASGKRAGAWVVVGSIVLVIVVILIVRMRGSEAVPEDAGNVATDSNAGIEDTSKGSVHVRPSQSTASAPTLSYSQAVIEYKDRRVQFDRTCSAIPVAQTWKNGTTIMLDNRSPEDRMIRFGSMGQISLKAWGFKIVKLESSTIPNAMAVDCGLKENIAIITVQR